MALSERRTRRRRRSDRPKGNPLDRLLAFVVRTTSDPIVCLAPDGRIFDCNPAGEKLYGYSRHEYLGRSYLLFVRPEEGRRLERARRRVAAGGTVPPFAHDVRRKDGTYVRILASVSPVRDDAGRLVGISVIHHDLTEELRAADDVRRLNGQLQRMIDERTAELRYRGALLAAQQETAPDGILVVDPVGRIVSHNGRFTEMWGLSEEVLAGGSDERALRSVLSKLVDPEGFLSRVQYLYDHPEEKSFEELSLRDGRTFERFSAPVHGDGAYYGRVWYFRDVSERKRAERSLRERTRELARSNAELEIYLNAAAHDLAAPLNKISVFADLLLCPDAAGARGRERDLAERIRRTAESMSRLVRDILTLARAGRGEARPAGVDWPRLAVEIQSDLELAISRAGARVVFGELPRLVAPEAMIRRVLLNLVANAVKFRVKDRPPVVEVGGRVVPGGVELFVRDNGIGFDPRLAGRLFKPFVRLNPPGDYEGSGIGLAVCERIAERLGGSLRAEGRPGAGATFTLSLPQPIPNLVE